jgi:chorismate mutase
LDVPARVLEKVFKRIFAMVAATVPEELLEVRKQIDSVDEELVLLLAKRFALTHQVGQLKASKQLGAVDQDREAHKLEAIKSLSAQHNLNPQLIANLFTQIMAEVVRNHRKLREE